MYPIWGVVSRTKEPNVILTKRDRILYTCPQAEGQALLTSCSAIRLRTLMRPYTRARAYQASWYAILSREGSQYVKWTQNHQPRRCDCAPGSYSGLVSSLSIRRRHWPWFPLHFLRHF